MKQIPKKIIVPYDALLVRKQIPGTSLQKYRKWLRHYLDFCDKYKFSPFEKISPRHFLKKLKEKKQSEIQQNQVRHAILLFQELKSGNVPGPAKKAAARSIPTKKSRKDSNSKGKYNPRLTNADWTPVYNKLTSEIKLRQYSSNTLNPSSPK